MRRGPGWTANLLALPEATVAVRGRDVPVRARLVEGSERAEIWAAFVAMARSYQAYEQRCARNLRLFLLDPVHAADIPALGTGGCRGSGEHLPGAAAPSAVSAR
ncbi:nitroreductase family deazaflavin-dependent oxidoreductase [Streptomyces sp. NPDC051173]|uniref:nitroreductase family deazaflavin-dependent oxidoreductase n=1 Tax=Streptomyces sp. NPDC051173 TaxID=3155164 RepID=UPI00344C927B